MKAEWYVINYDFNAKQLIHYNIINNDLLNNIKKLRKSNKIPTKSSLKDYLKKEFMHLYWSRTEYEIIVNDLISQDKDYKIDIWWQIEPNLDIITDYIINILNFRYKK